MAAFRGMHVSLCLAGDTKRLWENKQRCRRKIDLKFPFRAVGVRKGIKQRIRVQKERSTTLKRKYAVEEEKYRAKEKVESCDQKDRIDSPMDTTTEQPGPSGQYQVLLDLEQNTSLIPKVSIRIKENWYERSCSLLIFFLKKSKRMRKVWRGEVYQVKG